MQRVLFVLTVSLLLVFASSSLATIRNVPADYTTIQNGISGSANGDTVLVQPGIYHENVNFNTHCIVLASLFLTTGDSSYISSTIIDGSHADAVMRLTHGEDSTTAIVGFTIRNGWSGVYCYGSSPRITDNIITANTDTINVAAGVVCYYAGACIERNYIHHNSSPLGGGILCGETEAVIEIKDNIITDNTVSDCSFGMAPASGGGIYVSHSNPLIVNNLIANNRALGYLSMTGIGHGAGIYCTRANPTIIGNTIVGNEAQGVGGGIFCNNSHVTVINSILWGNTHQQIYTDSVSSATVNYSCVSGGWDYSGTGNISNNPLLVDVSATDFNLCSVSPCIDAGDPSMQDPDGSRADMGYYFEDHPLCEMGNVWYVAVGGDDISGDGSSTNPFATIQHAVNTAGYYDTIYVGSGVFTGDGNRDINLHGRPMVIQSLHGPALTIIDCQADETDPHRGFMIRSGEDSMMVIDGFTIRNGFGLGQGTYGARAGGAIYCENASPRLNQCILTSNAAGSGAGLYCIGVSSPELVKCDFIDNRNSGVLAGDVGGIGLYSWNASPRLIDCSFRGNYVISRYIQGGGIYCEGGTLDMTGCLFAGNNCHRGGAFFFTSITGNITNCTMTGNQASSGSGAVIYNCEIEFADCIFAYNTGSEAINCVGSGPDPVLTCTDIYGHPLGDWTGAIAAQLGVNGNISLDPLFCDTTAGDYRLSGYSPCARGNNECGERFGALDVGCNFYVCGDADGNGEITFADLIFIKDFYFAYSDIPVPLGSGDADCDGFVTIGDIVYLADFLFRNGPPPCCP